MKSASFRLAAAVLVLAALVALTPLVAHAAVGDVELISRGASEAPPANGDSGPGLAVTPNGRFVAFESKSTNLSDAAQPGITNLYLRDRKTGATTLVSRADGADGAGADADSASPSISPAGRFVAFESAADNLSPDDDDAVQNVFVRDTYLNTTVLVSRAADGGAAHGDSSHPAISSNGYFVAFASTADNLSTDDDDSFSNIYLRDIVAGTVSVVSRLSFGSVNLPADGDSFDPTIDYEGRRVAYTSTANNLSSKDNNAYTNVFVTDVRTSFTTAASLTSGGFLASLPADGDSFDASLSPDGRYVAFLSLANNFVDEPIRTPTTVDVFRRDIQAGETKLVSRATGPDGLPAFADSSSPSITEGGRYVAFESSAGNLSSEDTAEADIFVRGMDDSTTTLVSRESGASGVPADGSSFAPVISQNGRFIAFSSDADNLSASDDDAYRDVFFRRVPVLPPPGETLPDLGSNTHCHGEPACLAGAGGHDHAMDAAHAHAAGGAHDGHAAAGGAPQQSLIGPPVQDVDKLFVLVQPHADAKLVVTASTKLPKMAGTARTVRVKPFTRKAAAAHKIFRVRLRLTKAALKSVKRAIRQGKRVKVKVVSKAQALPVPTLAHAGDELLKPKDGPWSTKRRTIRLIDPR